MLKAPIWLHGMPAGKTQIHGGRRTPPPHAASSHLAGLTCKPTCRAGAADQASTELRTAAYIPSTHHPSPKFRRAALGSNLKSSAQGQGKQNRPNGSPCCTPVSELKGARPLRRITEQRPCFLSQKGPQRTFIPHAVHVNALTSQLLLSIVRVVLAKSLR